MLPPAPHRRSAWRRPAPLPRAAAPDAATATAAAAAAAGTDPQAAAAQPAAAAAATAARRVDYATADLQTFFTDSFDPNRARLTVGSRLPADALATLVQRVLLERPGAELCLRTFSAAAAHVATRALAQAHAALAAEHGAGLAVQPNRPNAFQPEMKMFVSRARPGEAQGVAQGEAQGVGEAQGQDLAPFKVSLKSPLPRLQGAIIKRFKASGSVRLRTVGSGAVEQALRAVAQARNSLAEERNPQDLQLVPELVEELLPARGGRPSLARACLWPPWSRPKGLPPRCCPHRRSPSRCCRRCRR
jgi:stage V sporulation protein SpoVS